MNFDDDFTVKDDDLNQISGSDKYSNDSPRFDTYKKKSNIIIELEEKDSDSLDLQATPENEPEPQDAPVCENRPEEVEHVQSFASAPANIPIVENKPEEVKHVQFFATAPASVPVTEHKPEETVPLDDFVPSKKGSSRKKSKKKKQEKPISAGREFLSWIEIIVVAAAIAFFLNTFIIANSRVPSGSMENTIMTGDRVIGLRLTYKFFAEPQRGDIIIFEWPDSYVGAYEKIKVDNENSTYQLADWDKWNTTSPHSSLYKPVIAENGQVDYQKIKPTLFVKRIIGMPGETVDIKNGAVYINNSETPLEETYIREPMHPDETFHFEVPEGAYFVMGDNRNNSADARYWNNTFVYKDIIISKVDFRYWPGVKKLYN